MRLTPREIQQTRNLGAGRPIRIQRISRHRHSRQHDAKDIQAPAHNNTGIVQTVLQLLAHDDEAGDHARGANVVGDEAGFGLEDALVLAHVARGHPVVEEVAEAFAQRDGDERREVQEADVFGAEAVAADADGHLQQDGGCDVYADGPHEAHCAGRGG